MLYCYSIFSDMLYLETVDLRNFTDQVSIGTL